MVKVTERYHRRDFEFNRSADLDTLQEVAKRLSKSGYKGNLSVHLDTADHPALNGSVELANENMYTLDLITQPDVMTYLVLKHHSQIDNLAVAEEVNTIVDIVKDCLEQKAS